MTYNFQQKLSDVFNLVVDQENDEVSTRQQHSVDKPVRLKFSLFGFGQAFYLVEPANEDKQTK